MAEEWKWVYRVIQVQECDAFARYLEYMARQGWHFKAWRYRLGFVKGEPEDAVYDVQIFSKARLNDLKAEGETLVFTDYCEAAGWKLVESKSKFCIFKRLRDDAVPIVTDEEKIENVEKIYKETNKLNIGLTLFLAVSLIIDFTDSSDFMFLQMLSTFIFVLICDVFSWISYWLGWRAIKNAVIRYEKTGELYFGRKCEENSKYKEKSLILKIVKTIFICGFALGYVSLFDNKIALLVMLILLLILFAVILWQQSFRPGREEKMFSEACAGIVCILLIMTFSFSRNTTSLFSEEENIYEKYIFGYYEYGDNLNLPDGDYTRYHWNSWVPDSVKNWVWHRVVNRDEIEETSQQTLKWYADDSVIGECVFDLKYKDDILSVYTESTPTQQQVDSFLKEEKIPVNNK